MQEIEQKSPLLKKQREDYDYAMSTVESLTSRMDEMEVETSRLRSANLEAEKLSAHLRRENKRLQETLTDLGRQVSCHTIFNVVINFMVGIHIYKINFKTFPFNVNYTSLRL